MGTHLANGAASNHARRVRSDTEFIQAFECSFPMLLLRVRDAAMHRFLPHLRSHNLTEQQWRILRRLGEGKTTDMLTLSAGCSILPPSLSRTIPLLIERGLVRRCSHGNDHRRVLVDLTPQGRSLFKAMSLEASRIYSELQAEIGTSDLQKLCGALKEFISVAEQNRQPSS